MAVARLGYIGISSQDPDAWNAFGSDLLGLMSVKGPGDGVYLKIDDHPYRIIVNKGAEDRLACMGWEVEDAAAYEHTIAALQAAGTPVEHGDDAGAVERSVSAYCSAADPAGNPLEIYHGRTNVGDAFESPQAVSRFLTGDMGLGHIVVPAPNTDETHAFYKDVLGFGDSDDLTLPPPAEGAPEMRVVFMHAANPRHHSLALFNLPNPTGIVHLMLEVPTIDEVGACLDRINRAGIPLLATLGRHCNDNMLSFYAISPGGIAVEYGCEGRQIDWQNFEATKTTVADVWGHEYQPVAV
ncbi:MAG: VOC family protein [Gammaproteobacteria bacterium]|nr:VOC family protein [Gammaproteobacteria bacterium]MDH3371914.1 VOC family protein [Gammaproteobacteria bacterium]MDH3407757.1 VOC family protein [Gammaproteobacteria bacterium]MDH3551124.1 VOC family protein [Gammaproteobacteria bacterium]